MVVVLTNSLQYTPQIVDNAKSNCDGVTVAIPCFGYFTKSVLFIKKYVHGYYKILLNVDFSDEITQYK